VTAGLNPPYTFANLRAASGKQLTDEINHQFDLLEHQRAPALRAQLLRQELARRDQKPAGVDHDHLHDCDYAYD
jgi:hypothetical protein